MNKAYKNGNVYIVVAIILALVLVGSLGFIYFQNLIAQKTSDSDSQAKETIILQPEDVTDKIGEYLSANFTVLTDDPYPNQLQQNEVAYYSADEWTSAYKVSGYNFFTNFKGGSTFSISTYIEGVDIPSANDEIIRGKIVNIYLDSGLSKDTANSSDDDNNVYVGKGLVCSVTAVSAQYDPTYVSCGLLSDYENAAETVKSLADVRNATSVTRWSIQDSNTDGYQTASYAGNNAEVLLYKKYDGDWQYFTATQAGLDCSEYNTTDIINAYMGETCYDGSQESTVK